MTELSIDRPDTREAGPPSHGERLWRNRHEIVGLALVATIWSAIVVFSEPFGRLWGTGQDAYCYWFPSLSDPYARSDWTDPIAYVYSPAFLQVLEPIRALPWQVYMAVWTAILLGAVYVLTGRQLVRGRASCLRSWSSPAATSICCWRRRWCSGSAGRRPGRSSCSRRSRPGSGCCGSSSGASGGSCSSRSGPRR